MVNDQPQAGAKAPAKRVKIRKAFISAGFKRSVTSRDNGDGKYSERWVNESDVITIKWGKR